ncbi:nucleoside deaminase [Candidatus Phytoplasma palmae]|uniref:nucleoside deaminase n=1 Tax=Candidatus Phytoplasma palmae TaxID=85624 RepID=UPI0039909437
MYCIICIMDKKHFFFMEEALKEAKKAFFKGEVPVGSIAVLNDRIIAKAHNSTKKSKLFFAHAEFLVLQKINYKSKNYRFEDITIYTTLEPCVMCLGALIQTRIRKLYFGTSNFKLGFLTNVYFSFANVPYLRNISVKTGLLSEKSELILKKFFSFVRKKR